MMPDEMSMGEGAEETEVTPPIVHDDIMQRLLDYQRQLREGLTPEQAAAPNAPPILVDHAALGSPAPVGTQTETVEVVDLAAVEATIEEPLEVIEVASVVDAADAAPSETIVVETKPAPADAAPQIWVASSITSEPTLMPAAPAAATDGSGDLSPRQAGRHPLERREVGQRPAGPVPEHGHRGGRATGRDRVDGLRREGRRSRRLLIQGRALCLAARLHILRPNGAVAQSVRAADS